MSRIGRMPIAIPAGVEVKIDGSVVTVKGAKATLTREFHPCVQAGPACIRWRTGAAEGTPRPWYCHRFHFQRRHDRQEGSRAERRR